MNRVVIASFTASLLLAGVPSSSDSVTAQSAKQDKRVFDESRGAILEGDAAHDLVERCGGAADPKGWQIAHADIKDLENELAPLLATDLKHVGSNCRDMRL